MEFHEKLQELRKNKKLTQEELAEILYVSRTTISKWESGRGYPSIDSLKQIALFFEITIDDLLSSEKLLTIAKQENDSNIQKVYEFMFGIVDVCTFFMILLPLYPYEINDYVYSINLFDYHSINSIFYWLFYILLVLLGMIKIYLVYKNKVIANGYNTSKTNPIQYQYNKYRETINEDERNYNADSHLPCVHAEMMCLINSKDMNIDWSKTSLFVYRESCGKTRMCKPCLSCEKALKDRGIKHIYYTSERGYNYERI